MINSDI